jgi:hypothetical protein
VHHILSSSYSAFLNTPLKKQKTYILLYTFCVTAYFARVELHDNATGAEYERLHSTMQAQGFYRAFNGSEGKVIKLPPGTYISHSNLQLAQVHEQAKNAASLVKVRNTVLTIQSAGFLESGWEYL